jgi:hypothetical protein
MTTFPPRRAESLRRDAQRPHRDERPAIGVIRTREVEVRESLAAAGRERAALQSRITRAFRQQLDHDGPGPSEDDLLLFAQCAIREQRLARMFAATRPALLARRR